jgi:hypothetical protein
MNAFHDTVVDNKQDYSIKFFDNKMDFIEITSEQCIVLGKDTYEIVKYERACETEACACETDEEACASETDEEACASETDEEACASEIEDEETCASEIEDEAGASEIEDEEASETDADDEEESEEAVIA